MRPKCGVRAARPAVRSMTFDALIGDALIGRGRGTSVAFGC
jgi:hypothetical protein